MKNRVAVNKIKEIETGSEINSECQARKKKILKQKIVDAAFWLFCVVVGGYLFLAAFTDAEVHAYMSPVIWLLAIYYFLKVCVWVVLYIDNGEKKKEIEAKPGQNEKPVTRIIWSLPWPFRRKGKKKKVVVYLESE